MYGVRVGVTVSELQTGLLQGVGLLVVVTITVLVAVGKFGVAVAVSHFGVLHGVGVRVAGWQAGELQGVAVTV
jgi:hypothetical protein